jgi:hypothetical protein
MPEKPVGLLPRRHVRDAGGQSHSWPPAYFLDGDYDEMELSASARSTRGNAVAVVGWGLRFCLSLAQPPIHMRPTARLFTPIGPTRRSRFWQGAQNLPRPSATNGREPKPSFLSESCTGRGISLPQRRLRRFRSGGRGSWGIFNELYFSLKADNIMKHNALSYELRTVRNRPKSTTRLIGRPRGRSGRLEAVASSGGHTGLYTKWDTIL